MDEPCDQERSEQLRHWIASIDQQIEHNKTKPDYGNKESKRLEAELKGFRSAYKMELTALRYDGK